MTNNNMHDDPQHAAVPNNRQQVDIPDSNNWRCKQGHQYHKHLKEKVKNVEKIAKHISFVNIPE